MSDQLIKATPTWEGIPPEIKDQIISSLNVLDRSLLRQVSDQDLAHTDKIPYFIDIMDVLTTATQLNINITEPGGYAYCIPKDLRAIGSLAILENSNVFINRLNLSSVRDGFGEVLSDFVETLSVCGVEKQSLRVKELLIFSENDTDEYAVVEFLEFCDPSTLELIKMRTRMTSGPLYAICSTEQWKNTNIEMTLGNDMNGEPVIITLPGEQIWWHEAPPTHEPPEVCNRLLVYYVRTLLEHDIPNFVYDPIP